MKLRLLSAILCATAAMAAEPKRSPVGSHAWDSVALARCSSPYKREVVADPQALTGRLTLACSTANQAHEQNKFPTFPRFEKQHAWELAGIPTHRYGVLTCEMQWEEMPHQAELRLASSMPGVLIQDVLVECLQILDSERIEVRQNGWPEGMSLAAHDGTRVWFAQGLYHDYHRLDPLLKNLPGPVKVDRAVHFKVGQHPTGFQDASFPAAEDLVHHDLVVIANVDLITFRPPERDRLRGWVHAGGHLLMLRGPYGFGSGDWHLSDLLAPMFPAEIAVRFDLQSVGVHAPVLLQPVSDMARKLDWSQPPAILWQHVMKAKPEATVHALADDPALRIDEVMDLKTNCPEDDPLYVAVLLNDGWRSGRWQPDAAFFMTTRRKDKFEPFEAALQAQGFQSRYVSTPVDYGTDRAVLTEIVPHDCWSERAHYFGLVESSRLRETKALRFLAVVPLHAGTWRAAHWVFPPRSPHLFQQVLSYTDGSLELRWTLRAQPHSQNLLHTGEYDPDFGLTGVRRLWALVGGPFQYHDTLHPFRNYEGSVNLDNYKDWNLAWSEETRAVRSSPPSQEDLNSPPITHLSGAFVSDDREYGWFSHYRQAEKLTWAVDLRRRLEQPGLSPAERGRIQRNIAAFCHFVSEPDFNTRASMSHQGNPNMPVNRFFALPFAAALIPEHPMATTWMDASAAYVRYKAGGNTAPLGAWSELISYYAASAPTVMHGALVIKQAGRLDDSTATLATGPMDFTLRLLSPVDPRFNARVVPGFGHEGALMFNQWTPAASLIRDLNPELAAGFVWAWDQQKRPGPQQHDNGFTHLTASQTDLLAQATPEVVRRSLVSSWLPGFGATLRAFPGDPNETFLAYRQGYLASHSDANQGDFVIYAKGAPLTVMSLAGYAIHNGERKQLCDDFGWHSRVRFGKQTDNGGWPGGGPVSGVHRHFFSDSADYLRGIGDYSPRVADPKLPYVRDLDAPETVRWARQILFLKDKRAAGPNYFVFRDSFRNRDRGDKAGLPQTWWYQRTLGSREQVKASETGFDYSSQWGQKMHLHFLQPARVQREIREVTAPATLYNQLARTWLAAGTPVAKQDGEASATISETITVYAAGPISPGEDVMVAVYPQGRDEAVPRYEALSDGVARITTASATDYVFASLDGLTFEDADVSFNGVAGAVRIFRDEVHLSVFEGAGSVRYQRCRLHAGQPVTRVVPIAETNAGRTLDVPRAKVTLSFALDEKAGPAEQLAPGVRKQTLSSGVAFEFNTPQPIRFAHDQAIFVGRRGGIRIDTVRRTVRLVLLDGQQIGYGRLQADVGAGPYDLTFHHDKVVGVSEGPGRFVHVTMPEGIIRLPALTIGGISYAPGTYGNIAIVPVLDDRCEFTLQNLTQPPVFRSWQQW